MNAVSAGARFRHASFLDVVSSDDGLIVISESPSGERVESRALFLVGADGATSRVVRSAWGRRSGPSNRRAFAHRQYVRWSGRSRPAGSFDFEPTAWGEPDAASYAWRFQVNDELANVGVCQWEPAVTGADVHLREFVSDLSDREGSPTSTTSARGGWINFDLGAVPPVVEGKIALAGDALGLADPTSGEGISHALRSGLLAARAIDRALHGSDLAGYALDIGREFANPIAGGLRAYIDGWTVAGLRDGFVPSSPESRRDRAACPLGQHAGLVMSPDVVDLRCGGTRLLASPIQSTLTELSDRQSEILDGILWQSSGARPSHVDIDPHRGAISTCSTEGEDDVQLLITQLIDAGVLVAGEVVMGGMVRALGTK